MLFVARNDIVPNKNWAGTIHMSYCFICLTLHKKTTKNIWVDITVSKTYLWLLDISSPNTHLNSVSKWKEATALMLEAQEKHKCITGSLRKAHKNKSLRHGEISYNLLVLLNFKILVAMISVLKKWKTEYVCYQRLFRVILLNWEWDLILYLRQHVYWAWKDGKQLKMWMHGLD